MKISDGQAVGAYQQQGSCEKAAVVLGVNAETIRLRLIRAGIPRPRKHRPFSVAEIEQIRAEYAVYRNAGRIKDFAHRLGRTPQALQGQASKLGLGSRDFSGRLWPVGKHMSAEAARVLFESFLAARVPVAKFCAQHGYRRGTFSELLRRHFPDEWDLAVEQATPRQRPYQRGREFEYRVRDFLKTRGFVVLRSPRSGSPLDLIAVGAGRVLFVQCKKDGHLPPNEWNTLYDLAAPVAALALLAQAPTGRGIVFHRLVSRKEGHQPQPYEVFVP